MVTCFMILACGKVEYLLIHHFTHHKTQNKEVGNNQIVEQCKLASVELAHVQPT